MTTCLTCKWRRAVDKDSPEAMPSLFYKCIRMPRHELFPLDRVDAHTCGEHALIEVETILRAMFATPAA